ncbi:MAG TPA: DEAD/DEAH box helicase [Bacteroidia bacterium]|nr:DEAD/DEAH box helicase [Bacteroidia bacterium]
MKFSELSLINPLLEALNTLKYTTPTPIQMQSIPHIMEGKDIFGCAQTGTGKTAAFALPILQKLTLSANPKPGIKALILAPTRELALQIDKSFADYGSKLNISHCVVFGGVSQHAQTTSLKRGVQVVVATPGRLLDLMQQGYVKLHEIEYFVLDEADRMLDMGFINDIRKIIAKLPAKKQTIFFSATVSPEIMKLANTLLHNPVKVNVTPVSTPAETVEQSVYYVQKEDKRSLLKHIIKSHVIDHALVFTRTKRGADRVAKELNRNGIKADSIHGDKSQNARVRALNGFKERKINILVATDIAARGIDVDKLSHVINYEIPEQAETYVHRIGRTGRAGANGIALSFCTKDEMDYLKDIRKLIQKNIEVVNNHPYSNK